MPPSGFDQPLVQTGWLATQLADPDLRIFDCSVTLVPFEGGVRPESGRVEWARGHIPGSGFADLPGDLSDPGNPLPMMMPSYETFADVMGRYGANADSRIVLYDTGIHTWATRLWWMLRAAGFDNAAVLDGGMKKWRAERRPVSTAPCGYPQGHFVAQPRADVFVDGNDVLRSLADPAIARINALSADEHHGRLSRTARAGRIPGSGNVPAASLLDPTSGAYRPLPELRAAFDSQGVLDGRKIIAYCGGGIAATSVAFTLARLGADAAVYDGSLSEWTRDPDLPMETG